MWHRPWAGGAVMRVARLLLVAAAAGCVSAPHGSAPPAPSRLELVGQLELPAEVTLEGVPLGGLSAIAYDAEGDLYHALADDPGAFGPPRLYRLRLSFDSTPPAAEVLSWQPLRDSGGEPYPAGIADPEGLALLVDGSLLVASEGLADQGIDPFLRRFAADGRQLGEVPLPSRYLPEADGSRGVRSSLGFESLTIEPGGERAYLATEGPLAQDGPAADLGVAGLARILVLSWPDGRPLAEHAYRIEPLTMTPRPADGFRVGGLVELLALDRRRLLALERQFAVGSGFSLRLYAVGLSQATDLTTVDALPAEPGV
ncbi:MAG: esterase-like activity of phytase family protein, partial [Thermoanaerobaculia bacterium]